MNRTELGVGARVRLSELGRKNSRLPERRGRIIGVSRTGTAYRVRWEALKGADLIHWSYLEQDQQMARITAAPDASLR